jgi:hypothetical protein
VLNTKWRLPATGAHRFLVYRSSLSLRYSEAVCVLMKVVSHSRRQMSENDVDYEDNT